jgi:hypothetical protein
MALVLTVFSVAWSEDAGASGTSANVTAFCRAETYIARYDANGATVFGTKGQPLSWPSVASEKLELANLDAAQASAAQSAPTAQLASYSRTMSTQFVPWLEDPAILNFYVHPTKDFKRTKLVLAAIAAQTDAGFIMKSHSFTDPVEHYCPTLDPPPLGTTKKAPHVTNWPAYDTTPEAVEVSSYIASVSFGDELNNELTAFKNPSLSHLRAVLARDNTGVVRATFVGTPTSVGGPKDEFGEYYWDITYRAGLHGQFFTVQIHLYRPNDASKDVLASELARDPLQFISFTPDT